MDEVIDTLETFSLSDLLYFSTVFSNLVYIKHKEEKIRNDMKTLNKKSKNRSKNIKIKRSRLDMSLDEIIAQNNAKYEEETLYDLCDSQSSDISLEELDDELDEIEREIYHYHNPYLKNRRRDIMDKEVTVVCPNCKGCGLEPIPRGMHVFRRSDCSMCKGKGKYLAQVYKKN